MQLPYFPLGSRATWRRVSSRTVTTATLGALLLAALACRDAVTGPGTPRPHVEPTAHQSPDRPAPKPDGEEITITRTTETFDRREGRLALRDRRVKLTRVGRTVASARNGAPARATATNAVAPAGSDLPPVGLTMEGSRRGPSMGLAWRKM